ARLRSLGYISGRVTLDNGGPSRLADPKEEIGRYVSYVAAFNEAMAQLEGGRARDAERGFRALARAFPRAFEPHQYLGRSLAARGAHRAAIHELDMAISLSPHEAVLYFDAGRMLADVTQFDAAFARVAEGLRLEPASFYGWLTRGQIAAMAGQREAAARAFREALTSNPSLAVAHLELGRLAE